MRIFVKYNRDGEVLSVSKVNMMPAGIEQPYGSLGEDESVVEVPAEGELLQLGATQIHESYKVNVEQKKLFKAE